MTILIILPSSSSYHPHHPTILIDTAGDTSAGSHDDRPYIPIDDLLKWAKIAQLELAPSVVRGILATSRDYELTPGSTLHHHI